MGAKAKGDVIEPVPVPISDAERRRAPRVLLNLEVDYASEDNYLFAYITDISATGIFVRTTAPEQPGTHLNLKFGELEVEEATPKALGEGDLDICFFSVGTATSRELVAVASAAGALCVDKSSAFRLQEGVPLVVPEVNGERALEHTGIIANPNCCAIPLSMVLAPLHDAAGLRRVRVATYQSVSGAGTRRGTLRSDGAPAPLMILPRSSTKTKTPVQIRLTSVSRKAYPNPNGTPTSSSTSTVPAITTTYVSAVGSITFQPSCITWS